MHLPGRVVSPVAVAVAAAAILVLVGCNASPSRLDGAHCPVSACQQASKFERWTACQPQNVRELPDGTVTCVHKGVRDCRCCGMLFKPDPSKCLGECIPVPEACTQIGAAAPLACQETPTGLAEYEARCGK